MFPFNNHLIIEPIEDGEVLADENRLFIPPKEGGAFKKVILLKYSKTSPQARIWQKSLNNKIWINSSYMFDVVDEYGKKVYLIPESAVVCGYVNKNKHEKYERGSDGGERY